MPLSARGLLITSSLRENTTLLVGTELPSVSAPLVTFGIRWFLFQKAPLKHRWLLQETEVTNVKQMYNNDNGGYWGDCVCLTLGFWLKSGEEANFLWDEAEDKKKMRLFGWRDFSLQEGMLTLAYVVQYQRQFNEP